MSIAIAWLVGHSEGGSVGLIAASKERRIAALVLVACSGVTGAELNLAQVNHNLSRSYVPRRTGRPLICSVASSRPC
jgi:pimeloyl-ACP methyl ester carboxylesterase